MILIPVGLTSPAVVPQQDEANQGYWNNQSNQTPWMARQPSSEPNNFQSAISPISSGEYNSGITADATEGRKPRTGYDYYDSNRNEVSSCI